jgi:nitric oxide reductase NorE protein
MDSEGPPLLRQSDVDADHPGTSGIWTFVFIDMIVFALLFLVFVSEKFRLPEIFSRSQGALDPTIGLVGTLLLLTSSWAIARSIQHVRAGNRQVAGIELNIGILLGLGFVANKLFEYIDKFAQGLTPVTNGFFTFYFLITFFHFMHVIGGLLFLGHCRLRMTGELGTANYRKKFENTGLFWHFVDMLWLFIFPMLYLTGAAQ